MTKNEFYTTFAADYFAFGVNQCVFSLGQSYRKDVTNWDQLEFVIEKEYLKRLFVFQRRDLFKALRIHCGIVANNMEITDTLKACAEGFADSLGKEVPTQSMYHPYWQVKMLIFLIEDLSSRRTGCTDLIQYVWYTRTVDNDTVDGGGGATVRDFASSLRKDFLHHMDYPDKAVWPCDHQSDGVISFTYPSQLDSGFSCILRG